MRVSDNGAPAFLTTWNCQTRVEQFQQVVRYTTRIRDHPSVTGAARLARAFHAGLDGVRRRGTGASTSAACGTACQHQLSNALRVSESETQRIVATHRVPDNRGCLDFERVEDALNEGCSVSPHVHAIVEKAVGQPTAWTIRHDHPPAA